MNIGINSTQYTTPKNIWASTSGIRRASLTIDMTTIPETLVNAVQKRIAYAGTAFAFQPANNKYAPYDAAAFGTTQTAPIYYIDQDVDTTLQDQVVNGAYSGVLLASRLVTAPDNNIKSNMRSMDWR